MDADQRLLAIGLYINAALFLCGVFVAGIVLHHPMAWQGALVAAGMSYFAYFAQIVRLRHMATVFVASSVIAGVWAGVALLAI